MRTQADASISTDDLLARLTHRGLQVTRTMLAQDVKAGYLPKLQMHPRGPGRGIGRHWEPWAVRRAIYLYRLRKRGATGDLLRVLLFLGDGWGWDLVKPLCLSGITKLVAIQASPVRRGMRRVTPRGMDFLADDLAADVFNTPETARFVWGVGLFGSPLPRGSLLTLLEAFRTEFEIAGSDDQFREIERFVATSGLTWDRLISVAEAAEASQADAARRELLSQIKWFRRVYQTYLMRKGIHGYSSNVFTLFGCPPEYLQALCRSLPGRPTPSQMLAAMLAHCLVLAEMRETGELAQDPSAAVLPRAEAQGGSSACATSLASPSHEPSHDTGS